MPPKEASMTKFPPPNRTLFFSGHFPQVNRVAVGIALLATLGFQSCGSGQENDLGDTSSAALEVTSAPAPTDSAVASDEAIAGTDTSVAPDPTSDGPTAHGCSSSGSWT